VLAAMRSGRPAAISYLAHTTGLTRPTVANAVRALADAGRIVQADTRVQPKGGRQRTWIKA
jgi:DNA-binding IclR family transcriptional regulator